ncbi:undecaprenyldiphospho-muramoylpentapeptide beta-N-acetylglucosaminyltransferase [Oleiagrimonas sp. C23AA]|uniref:undecaprenyldiphospho-muramoylpentapeptide beta-N-acetylglucosaminyltransferase n=1 Tax=Oleiagrimonas sp. C23AA TaxID=2719047 RepID=UPI00142162CC|nr:undecaprenyldiphospho-muramoylpentapeptide beta-N-acetylglucosaminyltransferase [Oleiagrimonas sp. C23AA]NII09904.1 undecaprenyldiphospho-muramoylpentapeptide beta-N-acetylglucosaminyltransferase [Oleiagrimonas sp. C23AA]
MKSTLHASLTASAQGGLPKGPVLIMAGGTGGHIFPGLAAADALRERGIEVRWLGAAGGLETRLVPPHDIAIDTVPVGGLRGKGLATRLRAPFMLVRSIWCALRIMRRLRPRAVLSMGGFVAGPGGVAARLTGTPLLVHEQNRVPGFTNRTLARFARRVLVGFVDAFPADVQAQWVGNPVRADIAALQAPAQRMTGRTGRAHLLVLGGSQGARALNQRLPEALGRIPAESRPEVLHQCGQRHLEAAREAYAKAGVEARVVPFIGDMAEAYAWADFAVCRAGALTLAELCAAGLGALLVPFPFAVDDHQTRNAEAMRDVGAAMVVPERTLDAAMLSAQLRSLLDDRQRLVSMAVAARSLARPEAAQAIAAQCLEVTA